MRYVKVERPGYFGRSRDRKVAELNARFGIDSWKLFWIAGEQRLEFADACKAFYEESYFLWLRDRPADIDFICSFGEVIDNAATNISSGLDYTKQEAFSCHIQDICIRNVLRRLGRKFEGTRHDSPYARAAADILVVRSKDSSGYKFGPGNVPFFDPKLITQPSKAPGWANAGSVEDFWQSNKWICKNAG